MNYFYSNLKPFFVALFALVGVGAWADEVTDVLNQTWTGVTGTSYSEKTNLSGSVSSAVYSVQCAGGNSSIQLRSSNSNSGIVSTTSGGTVKKIVVTWNSNTTNGRTLNIYGSNTAYSAASDLYDSSKQGTLLGTIVNGTSTELKVEDSYTYIGIRSASGALYLDKVDITWETGSAASFIAKPMLPANTSFAGSMEVTITAEEGAAIYYTLDGTEPTTSSSVYSEALNITETTTVKAIAVKDEVSSSVASATYTAAPTYATCAAANAAATTDKIISRLMLTDALVTYVYGQNAYLQDATGAMLVFGATNLTVGDKVTGYVQGQLYLYNGLPEIANPTVEVEVVSSGNKVVPVEVDAADLAANPLTYVSQYVVVKPATFAKDAEVSTKTNVNFTVGETALIIRNNFTVSFAVEAAKKYSVAGLATIYNKDVQLYPTSADDIAEYVTYAITLTESEYGRIEVEGYKTEAAAGETVKFEVIGTNGYAPSSFELKTVDGDPVEYTTENGTIIFTMPAKPVVITGIYKKWYTITVAEAENGTVSAAAQGTPKGLALQGMTITVTATPDAGYELDVLTVKSGETSIEVTDGTFTMPEDDVIVSATFKKKPTLVSGTVYWIQDVSTGQFISQGDNWSTRSVAQDVGGLGFEVVYVSDCVYKLNNIMWNKVNNATTGLGADLYVDNSSPAEFTLTASGDGYLVSTGGNYLVNNGTENSLKEKPIGTTDNVEAASVWKFLTKDEYDAAIQAYKDGNAATYAAKLRYTASTVAALEAILATEFVAKDYTTSIINPTLGSNWDGWTHGTVSQRGEGAGIGQGCAEFWNGCGFATQTVSDLPNGLYKVTFVGTYRPKAKAEAQNCASEFASSPAFVYANDAKVEFLHWIDVTAKADGRSDITVGNGYQNTMYTYVTDGTLALGVVGDGWTDGYNWNPFGQFTLTYYSDQISDEEIGALVATIPEAGTVPTAVSTNLASLKSALESAKTIATYNNLSAAITTANEVAVPYAAYKLAADDAAIAGVATATINEQNTAVEEATDATGINDCTSALRSAIAAVTAFDITTFTITNATPYANGDGWTATNGTRLSDWASNPVTYDSGNQCAEMWSNTGASMLYTITNLPAGDYRLTAIAGARANSGGVLKVGDKTIALVSVGSVNDRPSAKTWFDNGNGINELYFTLDNTEAELTIGLIAGTSGDAWTLWRSFKLETFDEVVAASYLKPGYEDAMAAAVAYQSVDMFDSDKTALKNAISDNTVEEASATIEAYETAVVNLNAAVAAAATAADNYTRYNNIIAAIGENTNVDLTSFVINADFELGNLTGWTSVDGGSVADNNNFSLKQGTYYAERWKNGVALVSGSLTHDAIVLPAGLYRIAADAQNVEQYNNSAGGRGLFLCANDERTEIGAKDNYAVYIKVEDKTPLTIKFLQDNCTGNWISYDNVTLTYVAADYTYTVVEGKMNATVAAAQTAAKGDFEAAQTGANYQALMDAIAAAQASKDAYAVAGQAIAAAKALKDAHNFAKATAATTFADAIAAIETPYEANTLSNVDAAAAGTTLGTVVTGWHAGTNGAAVKYMNDGFSLNDFDAALYINTWSSEGESDGSNFKVPFYEYFAGDGSKLTENTWTGTLTGLENGLYSVSAWVRVRSMNGETAVADLTGITMNVNDGTAVDVTEGDQIGESRFQMKEYTAEGLVKDGTLNFNININEENNIHWLSFKNVKFTKVRDLNPDEIAVAPTAIALYNGETEVIEPIALNKDEMTVTLNPVYTPAEVAEDYINWTSSDESVATVSSLGEVTAVLPGTATITATSTLDNTVSASATVTVTFPESEVPATYFVNNGATRTVYTLGDNLIENGSFEYPNAYYGWTSGTGSTTAITSEKFDIITEGAANGDQYLKAKTNEGGANEGSLNTSWAIEPGKTYVFGYKIKVNSASTGNQYIGTSLNTTKGQENSNAKLANPAYAANEWTEVQYAFESGDNTWLVFNARWLASNISFDNFYLCEAEYTLEGNVDYATAAIPTSNIGTDAFQYSQDAIDAAKALVQGTATVENVERAYTALTTLNAPTEGKVYNIVNVSEGYNYAGYTVTFKSASDADLTGNTTSMGWTELPGSIYPQGVKFTAVDGEKNVYTLSYTRADGNTIYVSTGSTSGLGSANTQIRPATDPSKALKVRIEASTTDGVWYLWNTEAGKRLGGNGANDQGFFTGEANGYKYYDMKLQEAVENEVALEINAKDQYATLIVPFDAEVPADVKAYSASAVAGNKLTLTEATELKANTPYVLYAAEGVETKFAGLGSAYADATYADAAGLLTGVYADTEAPVGSYVLQNNTNENLVAFFRVGENFSQYGKKVGANRAYLTVPVTAGGVKAYILSDDTDGIRSVDGETGSDAIYNLSGQRVSKAQRGLYIVNGKKVVIK